MLENKDYITYNPQYNFNKWCDTRDNSEIIKR